LRASRSARSPSSSAVVEGLKGFPDAITAVFPEATVQTCIVHLLRHSLDFVSWKDRKPVAAALKDIYRAVDAAAGEAALTAFEDGRPGAANTRQTSAFIDTSPGHFES
jgi:transposase-like protein